jgi:septum formation inhibitor MinC
MDPIVLIAQMHTSGRDAAERLRQEGLGDLAALSRQKPETVAELLGISPKKAGAMIRDARRELDLVAEGPRPTTTAKKAASGKRQTRAKTAPGGKRKKPEGLTREETEALLAGEKAGKEEADPEPAAPEKPKEQPTMKKSPEAKIQEPLQSFWSFG